MGRLTAWHVGEVVGLRDETARVRTITLNVPDWPGHLAGQHVDVRLTAADGYRAERSYSLASPPDQTLLELTVERLADGEVSGYLTAELAVGDALELRGPIGGHFVWEPAMPAPLLLVAGGSGVVPLMAMLRTRDAARRAGQTPPPTHLVYSSRTWDDVIYRDDLAALAAADGALTVHHTLTRQHAPGWGGWSGRLDRRMLAKAMPGTPATALAYICGPSGLVEAVAAILADLGCQPEHIRTERFGPTGT